MQVSISTTLISIIFCSIYWILLTPSLDYIKKALMTPVYATSRYYCLLISFFDITWGCTFGGINLVNLKIFPLFKTQLRHWNISSLLNFDINLKPEFGSQIWCSGVSWIATYILTYVMPLYMWITSRAYPFAKLFMYCLALFMNGWINLWAG